MTYNAKSLIFISYRHSDGMKYADELCSMLRAVGLRVWRDTFDMPPGDIRTSVRDVLERDASGAVVIVTPKVINSDFIKQKEVPLIRELARKKDFTFALVSTVEREKLSNVLGLNADENVDYEFQYDANKRSNWNSLLKQLLAARMQKVIAQMREECRHYITINLESRKEFSAFDNSGDDLQVRINHEDVKRDNPNSGLRLTRQGLSDLQRALPILSEAVCNNIDNIDTIRFTGGMFLTPALAIGASFSSVKVGCVEVVDRHGKVWSSDPKPGLEVPEKALLIHHKPIPHREPQQRIAVFISLLPNPDQSLFNDLLESSTESFDEVLTINYNFESSRELNFDIAGALALRIADEIKQRARGEHGHAEIHLAYAGPVTMAILIARQLNTFKVVAYERLEEINDNGNVYRPTLRINTQQGIEAVLDSTELRDDGLERPQLQP